MKKRTVSICIIATLFMFSLILVIGAPNGRIKEVAALSTPTFILVSNATTVYATEFIRLTGTLSIPKTGTVILQWAINSSGLIYTKNEPITDGVFARDFGFSAGTGIWQLRVNWTGDATSNPATSNTITITVTPNPSPTPTPSATPTPTPTPTPTLTPTPSPFPQASPTPISTSNPSSNPSTPSSQTPTPTLTPTPNSSSFPAVSPTPISTFTPFSTGSTPPTQTPTPTSESALPSANDSQTVASVWVPQPANAAVAPVAAVLATGAVSVAVAAAITPAGLPTGKVTQKTRDLLPETWKKWLSDFISSKRKLAVDEKRGSIFLPTKSEAIAYGISIVILAFSFSYVKVNSLPQILSVLPTILATSILVGFVKTFALIAYSRRRGVWTEHRLWYFGLATFLVTTFAFRVPFSSPSRSVHHAAKFTKRLGAILSSAEILISLAFAGFFVVLLVSGFTMIGSTGLAMCIIGAFFDTFPLAPMNGKAILEHSKVLWATLFVVTLILYAAWLLLL